MPIYLSPEVPGWSPRTEADLQSAIDGGLLEESHRLDLKQALHATKGDNKELARDIASRPALPPAGVRAHAGTGR